MEVKRLELSSGELLFEKVEVIWRIENFNVIRKTEEFLCGQRITFQAGGSIGLASDWNLYLVEIKTPAEGTNRKWIGVFFELVQVPEGVRELMASVSIKIKSVGGGDYYCSGHGSPLNFVLVGCSCGCGGSPRTTEWGRRRVIPQDAPVEDLPLIDGALVIEGELILMKLKEVPMGQSRQKIEAQWKPRFGEKLQRDLGRMLGGDLEDLEGDNAKIVAGDKVEFAVNQGILSARSPVFEKMFGTPMTEAQTGVVTIPDLSSKTVGVLLRYLYTGTLHPDWSEEQVLPELIYAANKYELQDLVTFLDQAVGHLCSKENAGRLFILLGKVGMRKGEREVLTFIKSHIESFEDMANFVEESTREPDDNLQTVIISPNQKDSFAKKMKLDPVEP